MSGDGCDVIEDDVSGDGFDINREYEWKFIVNSEWNTNGGANVDF